MTKQKKSTTSASYFLSVFVLINLLSFGYGIVQAVQTFSGNSSVKASSSIDPNDALLNKLENLEITKKNDRTTIENLEEKNTFLDDENNSLREIISRYDDQFDDQKDIIEKLLQQKSPTEVEQVKDN